MFTVALTGGIGSGKSVASDFFATLGAQVIDSDLISRQLVAPGQPALQQIVDTFGSSILLPDGQLNRQALRRTIFAQTSARKNLEAILHPLIRQQVWQEVASSSAVYALLVIPLLYENLEHYPTDRILLIDIPETLQHSRVKARDSLSDAEVERLLSNQSSRAERLSIADEVILNTGSLPDLLIEVENLHHQYQQLTTEGRLY